MSTLDDFDVAEGALEFWYPADDSPVDETYLPWGSVARGSSADTRLRVRNESDDYAALAVVVALTAPLDPGVLDVSGRHLLSLDGDTFTDSITLPDLAPNSVSAPFVIRRVTPADQPAGVGEYLLTATATSWAPAGALDAGNVAGVDPAALTPSPENAGATTVAATVAVDALDPLDLTPGPAEATAATVPDVPVDADQEWTGP